MTSTRGVRTSDVLIIGGGIVGCACAYEIAKRGASVTLLEYGKTGMQATNAAAGMLAPLTETHAPDAMMRFGMLALQHYPRVVAELEAAAGFDVEYRQQGILKVAFTQDDADALRRRFAWQREMGVALDWLESADLRVLEPRLTERAIAGVFSPLEATVSNQLLALALERAAMQNGASIVQRAPVTAARRSRGRVTEVTAGGETYTAETIVLAAGARSGQIGRKLGVALPVAPVRGQMIALGGMSAPIHRVVWGPDGYLVPRVNGHVFAGATVEDVGFRRRTTRDGVRAMRAMASALVPQLASAQVRFEWAGLRPGTPDGAPIIGPVFDTNVVAATGHYRNGILLGPLTGTVVAEGVVESDWTAVPEAFLPERFDA